MDIIGVLSWVFNGVISIVCLIIFLIFVGFLLEIQNKIHWFRYGWGDPFYNAQEYNMIIGRLESMGEAWRDLEFKRVSVDDRDRYYGIECKDKNDKSFKILL
ncbi:MAG: hypothetical protein AAGU10_08325 [Methanosarcina mazei]